MISYRSSGRNHGVFVLFAAAMLAIVPPSAHAAGSTADGNTAEGWKKVIAYAGCAFSVFRAITPVDWAGAILTCSKLFADEPASPIGGA